MRIYKKYIMAFLILISVMVTNCVPVTADAAVEARKITLNSKNETTYVGGSINLKVSVTPAKASVKVIWRSSINKIATVTSKGRVIGKKAGTVTITAKAKTNSTKNISSSL